MNEQATSEILPAQSQRRAESQTALRGPRKTPLINREHCRAFLLDLARARRTHKWDRVSEETLVTLNEKLRAWCVFHVAHFPSKGKNPMTTPNLEQVRAALLDYLRALREFELLSRIAEHAKSAADDARRAQADASQRIESFTEGTWHADGAMLKLFEQYGAGLLGECDTRKVAFNETLELQRGERVEITVTRLQVGDLAEVTVRNNGGFEPDLKEPAA